MTTRTDNNNRTLTTGCAIAIIFYAITAAVAYLLISCAVTRSIDKTAITSRQTQRHETVDAATTDIEQTFKAWAQSNWHNVDLSIAIYDTTKPPDSVTARPPLLADIDLHVRDSATTEAIDSTIHESVAASTTSVNETTDDATYEHNKSDTQAGLPIKAMEILSAISAIAFAITVWLSVKDKIPKTK